MSNKKEYEGTVYTGVVGPESDYSVCWRSIIDMERRQGDEVPKFIVGTKGYELRQMHINNFMESNHSFLLMLDHDMVFPRDTLERLRSHKLPYVSGLYMRRQFQPMAPIWFHDNPRGHWPQSPYCELPESGILHKIGASGWGCILVHREVIQSVRPLLKGEPEVIEDDMDIWPYDLQKVMEALQALRELVNEPMTKAKQPALNDWLTQLEGEIKPLRGTKDAIGSDIRFPFFAKQAGYQLWGDPDVKPGHIVYYPLTVNDYANMGDDYHKMIVSTNKKRVRDGRKVNRQVMASLGEA